MQCILMLVFIWTLEVYSLINNTIFVNLSFDVLVVVGFIRWRWTELKEQSTSTHQRSLKVHARYFRNLCKQSIKTLMGLFDYTVIFSGKE